MRRTAAVLSLSFFLIPPASTSAQEEFTLASPVALERASYLDLSLARDGAAVHARKDEQGVPLSKDIVDAAALRRVMTFLYKLPKDDPEGGMAAALKSYLSSRMDPRQLEANPFLSRDASGRLRLSQLGKNSLFDILTARDGQYLEPLSEPKPKDAPVQAAVPAFASRPGGAAAFVPEHLTDAVAAAVSDPSRAFDGRHSLGAFDWASFGTAVDAQAAGRLDAFSPEAQGFSVNDDAKTVRVLVAADRSAAADRFKVQDPSAEGASILKETGLDARLFDAHGAKVVRSVDNLVAVDVPLSQASALGLALRESGVESRPARAFRAAAAALSGPAGSVLGTSLLPAPMASAAQAVSAAAAAMVDSRAMLKIGSLWDAGMRGLGSLVGIIDSGIDPEHQDFKDKDGKSRIQAYMDFTDEGKDDVVGHGTHVAGTVGGDGSASGGKFAGAAPETRFKMAKVFGLKGETDESVILAAMKWMVTGDKKDRVDVLNMSLGGPGEPNKDPISSMADRLAVKNNVLVVAAAGNEGAAGNRTVGSPGNARYALTVTGVNKDGEFPFFASKGPIYGESGELYNKPDVAAVTGDVDLTKLQPQVVVAGKEPGKGSEGAGSLASVPLAASGCIYAPGGVIAPRSGKDPDNVCTVPGYSGYRYMSGTSMAAPMVAGAAADVIGYLKARGIEYDAFQVKAAIMETAADMGKAKEVQGSGLLDGKSLVRRVLERISQGTPIGNVAYELSMRMTSDDQARLKGQQRYQMTPLGLLDTRTNHLVNTETEMLKAIQELRSAKPTTSV